MAGEPVRPRALLIFILAIPPAFAATGLVTRAFHARQASLGEAWHARGVEALDRAEPQRAIEAFRNALAYDRENLEYKLRLAEALMAAERYDVARTSLRSLRESQPGNGTINLQLARLNAAMGDLDTAVERYGNAVQGSWDDDGSARRRAVRLELARLLLASERRAQAEAELITLAADLPADGTLDRDVAVLLNRAGAHGRALELFRRVLSRDPRDVEALAGAGEAAFGSADYPIARRYLTDARRLGSGEPRVADLLEVSTAVLSMDPLRRGLSAAERARRVGLAYDVTVARLQACADARGVDLSAADGVHPLQRLWQEAESRRPLVVPRRLARDSELRDGVTEFVFRTQAAVTGACGAPEGQSRALALIEQLYSSREP